MFGPASFTSRRMLSCTSIATVAIVMLVTVGTSTAMWKPGGVQVTPYHSGVSRIGSDGRGGMFATWVPFGTGGGAQSHFQVWARRVLADGSLAPGWPDTGVRLADTQGWLSNMGVQSIDAVLPDGRGGAYVQFQVFASHFLTALFAHATATGSDLQGWPLEFVAEGTSAEVDGDGDLFYGYHQYVYLNGTPTAVYFNRQRLNASLAASQSADTLLGGVRATISRDDHGGAFACWLCEIERVDSTMSHALWSTSWPGCTGDLSLLRDGHGGAYVAWFASNQIRVTRIDANGIVVPGWPSSGVVAGSTDTYSAYGRIKFLPDDVDGVYLRWGTYGGDRIQRLLADGAIASGWPSSGYDIPSAETGSDVSELVPDGAGGVYLAWVLQSQAYVVATHLLANGSPAAGWLASGNPISSGVGSKRGVSAAPDGAGGAYIGWQQDNWADFAQHVTATDVVPLAAPDDAQSTKFTISSVTNPSTSRIECSFALPTSAPARIEAFDAAGRRIAEEMLQDRARRGAIRLGTLLPSGVYLVRLTQGAHSASTRVVVVN